jgi:adenine-specific DNA-methyltransferase
MARLRTATVSPKNKTAKSYKHPESESPMRPEVGTQSEFKKKLPPKKYRYDDSLSPVLEWDGQNAARERGEARIAKAEAELSEARKKLNGKPETKDATTHVIAAQKAVHELKAMSKPFLNWSGKAERLSFDVPTLPLFIHERLSTKAILETLKGHKRDKQTDMFDLFGDPQHSITDQVLRAYEHKDKWVNRMILGDSLVVMNSLLHYENLGGQIQMIYLDPPYGVKFGSNFQPFVRKRDVSHNDDDDMTREPEMVQAYRDTWELGLHSYLTFLRDRFLLARDLLHHSGSIFVQINDGNLHLVKAALDEIFEAKNAVAVIAFAKTSALGSTLLPATSDFLLWYARDKEKVKYHQLFKPRQERSEAGTFTWIELKDSTSRRLTKDETRGDVELPTGRRFRAADLTRMHWSEHSSYPFEFGGRVYRPAHTRRWATNIEGMQSLIKQNRIVQQGNSLAYKLYEDDFPLMSLDTVWSDTILGTFSEKFYVVQTSNLAVQRCILMTTDPGDLVLDPTCGSGTTAYCSEQWGRRWITVDTSRVPLALARQRLLTATYSWYELKDESRGPVAGLVYRRKQNNKGEEVGGIVPHVTLKSIANNEPPEEEVLVDRPESDSKITRVTGPFSFEATIPTPRDLEEVGSSSDSPGTAADGSFVDRMIEILRRTPVLRLEGNRTVTLKSVRPPAKSLSLSAEAVIANGAEKPVAFVFGPENGAVSEKLVYEAAREARAKNYTHLYVIGFAIQPNARELIEKCDS